MAGRADSHWWVDVHERTNGASTPDELLSCVETLAANLGFSYVCYGIRYVGSNGSPTIHVFDTYPRPWMQHYECHNYLAVDPTVQIGARSLNPIVWSDALFQDAKDLWNDARDLGLRVGLAQAAWSSGNVYGLLSLARARDPLTHCELGQLRAKLRWIAESTQARLHELIVPSMEHTVSENLSRRECDVLHWTTEGKTSWEISEILSISESTVNFHIKHINAKLGVKNKVQAAAKAATLGIVNVGASVSIARADRQSAKGPTSM